MIRLSRVIAVARADLQRVHGGRLRLLGLLIGVLLPVGAVPLQLPAAALPETIRVAGEPPAALGPGLESDPSAPIHLTPGPPIQVRSRTVPAALRERLNTLPGEPVVRLQVEPWPVPGRTLLLALLAISVLTGPLAESLPGERSARTLEVLLSAAVTRREILVGKWLAWTGYGAGVALLSGLGGLLTGATEPGLWLLGIPTAVAVAVAVGLWLVRHAPDVVSGAAVPMRVLPALAVGSGVVAWLLVPVHPVVAAAVPIGGALLIAGGLIGGVGVALACGLGTAVAVALLLSHGAASLDQPRSPSLAWAGVWAVVIWWLCAAGPGVWGIAGNTALSLPTSAATTAGGIWLGLLGGVALARRTGLQLERGQASPFWFFLAIPVLILVERVSAGVVLPLPTLIEPLAERLIAGALPTDLVAMLALSAGAALLFQGALSGGVIAWTLALFPVQPLTGLLTGLVLALVGQRCGLLAACFAHLGWLLLRGLG